MHRRQFLNRTALAALVAAWPFGRAIGAGDPSAGDLDLIREAIALHPGALRYLDPAALERAFAVLAEEWLATPKLAERYLALTAFLAKLRCGHTYCNFYNQTDEVEEAVFVRTTRLPFFFRWIDGDMVVTRDLTGKGLLAAGTRISRIDGRPPAEMLAALMPLARADGGNDAKRMAQLEVTGGERFPAFDIYQGLLFPPEANGGFALSWIAPDASLGHATVPALTPAQRLAAAPPPEDDGSPLWTVTERSDGIIVLTMPTWVVYRSGWDWGSWLKRQAPKFYSARGLVIDLRGNEGGLSCGDPILARLSRRDIALDDFDRRVRFRRIPVTLDGLIDTPSPDFRTLGIHADALGNGWYGLTDGEAANTISAASPTLTIPVAVLTDAANSSATFLFAHRVKRHGLARLFGSTTGGNQRGINGGAVGFVRLPASGIEFDVPLIGYFAEKPAPDRGIEPDVDVSWSIRDIADGRDPVMAAASRWIVTQKRAGA